MSGFAFQPVQMPDFGATLARGQAYGANQLASLAQMQQLDLQDRRQNALAQFAPLMAEMDPQKRMVALASLARVMPEVALPMMQGERDRLDWTGGAVPTQQAPQGAPIASPGGDTSQPRGIRNNNPLNIEAGNFTQGLPGFQGSDGRFARFASMDQGLAAADRLLESYGQKGLNTPIAIVSRWAPAGDGNNNPQAYAATVARQLGVQPDTPLDMANPEVRRNLALAMAKVENGQAIPAGAPGGGGNPGFGTPEMPAVPGFDMERVRRAMQMPNNPYAKQYLENYYKAAGLLLRENAVPPTVQLGAGPHGPAGVYRQNRDGSLTRLGDPPPPSTMINQTPEGITATADRETMKQVAERANQARTVVNLLDAAENAARRSPEGYGAQWAPIIGQVGRRFGLNISGTSDAEVLQGLTSQLATLQRMPGSGATSDFEMGLYMRAVPQLSQTAEGRQKLIEMGRAIARRQIEEYGIWRRHAGSPDLMDKLDALPRLFNEEQTKFLEAQSGGATPAQPVPGPGGVGIAEPPPPPPGFRVIR